MTYYYTPIAGDLRPNPDITPSFKEGDFVVLKKDCISGRDPDGPSHCLVEGESFEIVECGLEECSSTNVVVNSRGEIIKEKEYTRLGTNIEWCIVEADLDFCTGGVVNAEDVRLLTAEDLENDDF